MKNAALYTPAIAEAVKGVAYRLSRHCDWTTEADELFSAGQHAVLKRLPKYDAAKHPDFEGWACSRATWGIRNFQRAMDIVPRYVRDQGVTHNPMVYLDMKRGDSDDDTGLLDCLGFFTDADRNERADEIAHMLARLETLDHRYRATLRMHYIEGLDRQVIAKIMGRNRATITVWIDLGLAQMRREMKRAPLPLAA